MALAAFGVGGPGPSGAGPASGETGGGGQPERRPHDGEHGDDGGEHRRARRNWTFLTNHGHVLLAIARNPTARLRDVADEVGVTERAAQAIVADLEAGGYLHRTRVGRRNEYTINPSRPVPAPGRGRPPGR